MEKGKIVNSSRPTDDASFLLWVQNILELEFSVKDAYLNRGVPTFIVASDHQMKEKFERLNARLQPHNLFAFLSRHNDEFMLSVVSPAAPAPERGIFSYKMLPLLLFLATIVSVSVSGYFASSGYIATLKILGKNVSSAGENLYLLQLSLLYTLAIMGIIGLHELGHLIACRYHGVKATIPYFIPGIPGLTPGTFGAIIRQKSPPVNRDQLFDIGFSGPIIGFVVALIVSYFGYAWSIPVSEQECQLITRELGEASSLWLPLIFSWLGRYIFPNPDAYTHFLHPLALAGWIGTLIAFLNTFPVGQLDGGHVSRSVLGPKWHRVLSYVFVVAMLFTGWWLMAILAFFMATAQHPGPLDDVSKLTTRRKAAAIFLAVMFVLCFTFAPSF